MINTNEELNTFENYERAIVRRLTKPISHKLTNELKIKEKLINSNEVLKLNELMSLKLYNKIEGLRLTTEYLNFLIRFYENKTPIQSKTYIKRFLDCLNLDFKNLNVSKQKTTYKKLIRTRYKDFVGFAYQKEMDAHFENTNNISYCLSVGLNQLHFIN